MKTLFLYDNTVNLKRLLPFICFVLQFNGFAMAEAVPSAASQTPAAVQKNHLELIKKSGLNLGHSALLAIEIKDGGTATLVDHRSEVLMTPASITKLATGAAFINQFPPGTKIKTSLMSPAKIEGSTLKGSLCAKGGGDPSFVSENMWFLVNQFVRNKITKVTGNIVVDDSVFDSQRVDPSRTTERVDRAYDAPVGGLSFNWNSVNIFIRPNILGQPPQIFLDPENDYVKLENKARTIRGGGNQLIIDRIRQRDGKNTVRVSGKIGVNIKELVVFKSITDPDLWFGYNLKAFLAQRGIEVTGTIQAGECGANDKVLAEAEARGSELILADMNKFSNNYVAEMITKQMGLSQSAPGTITKGINVIKKYLKGIGIQDNEYVLENPSGLTNKNKFSAKAMVKLLAEIHNDFRIAPELLSSLPISGIDGTLKKRFQDTKGERWIRAKTGLLNGVVALAGYAGKPDGSIIVFAFMFNGSGNEAKVRSHFDDLVVSLLE